jgi:hypothetical protein
MQKEVSFTKCMSWACMCSYHMYLHVPLHVCAYSPTCASMYVNMYVVRASLFQAPALRLCNPLLLPINPSAAGNASQKYCSCLARAAALLLLLLGVNGEGPLPCAAAAAAAPGGAMSVLV